VFQIVRFSGQSGAVVFSARIRVRNAKTPAEFDSDCNFRRIVKNIIREIIILAKPSVFACKYSGGLLPRDAMESAVMPQYA